MEETVAEARAAPVAAAAPAPEPRQAAKAAAPSGPGIISRLMEFFGKWLRRIILMVLLGVLAAAGYLLYMFFFPEGKVPWEELKPEIKVEEIIKSAGELGLKPPPEPVRPAAPPPKPKPAPVRRAPPPGDYSIQVATCFFDSCVETFRKFLEANRLGIKMEKRTAGSETIEVYTSTAFTTASEAQDYADRINREHQMEGRAYVFQELGSFHISMGVFMELGRVNAIRDALNERYGEELRFSNRLKRMPYNLRSVLAGSYASESDANKDLRRLRSLDSRFAEAFIVNTKKKKR